MFSFKKRIFFIPFLFLLTGCSYSSSSPREKVEAIENVAQGGLSDSDIIPGKVNQVIQDYVVTGDAVSYTDTDTLKHDIAAFFKNLKDFDEYSMSYLVDSVSPPAAAKEDVSSVSSGDFCP